MTDYNTLLYGSGQVNRSGLLTALEKRGAYVIIAGEDPEALSPGNVNVLVYGGVLFNYDATDALTAHDGVSCIVTADGKRFKTDQLGNDDSRNTAVLDKDLDTPPGSPTVGDRYIVAAGGTGAWTGKDEQIARFTARGWKFTVPNAWDIAFVEDEGLYYHYDDSGDWVSGLAGLTIADTSISLKKLKYFPLGVAVENQTTNDPPGGPADGVAYIVGGAPSGAWVGHSLEVAIYETSAWVFYAGYEGARVYDKNLNAHYTHNGATWATPAVDPEVYVGRMTFNNDATKEMTGLSGYSVVRLRGVNIMPVNDNVQFRLRISSDGVTFLSSNHAGNIFNVEGTTTAGNNVNNSSAFEIDDPQNSLGIGNNSGDGGLSFDLTFRNFNQAQKTHLSGTFVYGDTGGNVTGGTITQWHTGQTAMQAIQALFSNNNLASGHIDVWGTP